MRRRLVLLGAGAALLVLPGPDPAGAEIAQKGPLRVAVSGGISPTALPRAGSAPVSVKIGGHITSTAAGGPPQLRRLSIAVNREGRLALRSRPRCRLGHIQPSTGAEAMLACGPALVGEGSFSAKVKLPEQSPFPSRGKVLVFNGVLRGQPAVFAHIYGTRPVPVSYVLPFRIEKTAGTFGTVLDAAFPQVTGDWGYVTGISIDLGGKSASGSGYLSAGCPAPAGFPGAVFPLFRTTFAFEGGIRLSSTLNRTCRVQR